MGKNVSFFREKCLKRAHNLLHFYNKVYKTIHRHYIFWGVLVTLTIKTYVKDELQ